MGVRARTLQAGEDPLAWMNQHSQPDLVIVDLLRQSSTSGAELLSRLRGKLAATEVPIVVLTAAENVNLEKAVLGRGPYEYVVNLPAAKPLVEVLQEKLAEHARSRMVGDAVRESLSGLLSEHRTAARIRGATGQTIRVRVALAELRRLVKARLDGLRGAEEPEESESPLTEDDLDEVAALEVEAPSLDDLRRRLPLLGARIAGDSLELDVQIPVARPAHAR